MVVDDDGDHVELIRRALEPSARYRLVSARTIAEAQARLQLGAPDLLLLDLRLPDGEGTELVSAEASYPVVVMTSHGNETVAVDALRSGALDYLVKSPETFGDMPHILDRALREWDHIVEGRRMADRLNRLAFHDELTGLPNRTGFLQALEAEIVAQRAGEAGFAMLFLDLDRFKLVNDSFGHTVGDRLFAAIAERLRARLGPPHLLARFGGDELMVLLRGVTDPREVEEVADTIHGLLSAPFSVEGHNLFVTASIGIVLSDESRSRPENYLRDADIAMYHAKRGGASRHAIFDASMRARVLAALRLQNDLRRAIDGEQFEVHYQPIVSIDDAAICGLEALVRWRHPGRGLLHPSEFMHMAEETGLIIPVDRWVLGEACRQLRRWQEQFPGAPRVRVSVNLSGHQLTDASLVPAVREAMGRSGVSPESLALEITEGILVNGAEAALRTTAALCELGVRLHLDDFGVGYSSLSYLHRFPIHALKIDRSFVDRLARGDKEEAIVRTIIVLGRHLGIDVTAEGVEDERQLARLRELGCARAQGFLFSRPLPADEATALLRSGLRWRKGG
ncbi:MAG: EAL domain-containing protein [Nannocystaceae bacterium]|nr:EAL domain-containing protein [Myxococcales bacterium]